MSNVITFPTPATRPSQPDPTTPEGWRDLLFAAGERVVHAQMMGGDAKKAKAEYVAIEARLPAEVRDAMSKKVSAKDVTTLVEAGWDFFAKLLELRSRF